MGFNCTSNGMFLYVLYFKTSHTIYGSCDTAFGMGWMIQRLNPRKEKRFFSSPECPDSFRPTQLPVKEWLFPQEYKWLGYKADHLPSSRAKVMSEWHCTITLLPLHALTTWMEKTFTSSYNSPRKWLNIILHEN